MEPKPAHLGACHASQFEDEGVEDAYLLRPRYPDETISVLERLAVGLTL